MHTLPTSFKTISRALLLACLISVPHNLQAGALYKKLLEAAEEGQIDQAKKLLRQGVNITAGKKIYTMSKNTQPKFAAFFLKALNNTFLKAAQAGDIARAEKAHRYG